MRKNGIVILICFLGGLIGLFFLINFSLAHVIERVGSKALRSNVSVNSARFTIAPLGFKINGLKSHSAQTGEVITVANISGDLEFYPLLLNSIVINSIEATGASYEKHKVSPNNTVASSHAVTSGSAQIKSPFESATTLAQKSASKSQKKEKDALEKLFSNADVKNLVDYDSLPSTHKRKEVEANVRKLNEKWDAEILRLNFTERNKTVKENIEKISSLGFAGLGSFDEIKKRYELISSTYKDAEKLYKDIEANSKELNKEISDISAQIKDLKSYTDIDIAYVKKQLNLSENGVQKIGQVLLGKELSNSIFEVFRWIEIIQGLIPNLGKGLVANRSTNNDIIQFENRSPYPKFWIKKVEIDGKNPRIKQEIKGTLLNFSTDQRKSKALTKLFLNTTNLLGDNEHLKIAAIYTQEKASLNIDAALGNTVSNRDLLNVDSGKLSFATANQTQGANLTFTPKVVDGTISITFSDFKTRNTNPSSTLLSVLGSTLEEAKQLRISARIKGSSDDPKVEINSNLDSLFAKAVQRTIDDQRKKLEKQIEKEINAQIVTYQKQLDELLGNSLKSFQNQLEGFEGIAKQDLKSVPK